MAKSVRISLDAMGGDHGPSVVVPGAALALGMPLLKLERLTFRFVEAGFAVLTVALLFGLVSPNWQWRDHKTVLSLLGWATFAALIGGRLWRGWRGRQATRWLYAGTLLLFEDQARRLEGGRTHRRPHFSGAYSNVDPDFQSSCGLADCCRQRLVGGTGQSAGLVGGQ